MRHGTDGKDEAEVALISPVVSLIPTLALHYWL